MENDLPPIQKSPPPLITPPPIPRRQPKNRGWMIAALVLAALLLYTWFGSVMRHLAFGSGVARHRTEGLEEILMQDKGVANKIAVVEVSGLITSEPWDGSGLNIVEFISKQLKMASADKQVRAVILKVNSPGGEVMASDDISQAILDFRKTSKKPIVASMGSLAASGGYYVSVPCEWIVASDLTITGSIGVIMPSYNYRKLLDKIGVRPEIYKSGKFKDMLSGSKSEEEILPEERIMLQGLIDETYKRFKGVVQEGRQQAHAKNKKHGSRELDPQWEGLADGRILTGKQAYDSGFVDELGNFDVAVQRTMALANISEANLIRYEHPFSFGSLFRLFGKAERGNVKIDLGLELPKLQAGHLYFLSSSILQ
jgi:protease-4